MAKTPREWLEKAEFFHRSCRQRHKEGVYWATCFEAQQAIEILLKGLQVAFLGVHEFTHDLSRLLRGLEAAGISVPEELYVYADALTPFAREWSFIVFGVRLYPPSGSSRSPRAPSPPCGSGSRKPGVIDILIRILLVYRFY